MIAGGVKPERRMTTSVQLTITDVVYRGLGIGRLDGCVVFVPGVLPAETVCVEITHRRKNFAEARLLDVLRPSPHRIAPVCPLAAVCPGCRYQHVEYEEELRLKHAQLANLLARMAGVPDPVVLPPVASPENLGYRNKIVLHGALQQGRATLGYVAEDNVSIIDVPACPLAVPALNAKLRDLRSDARFMAELKTPARVTLRHTPADGATWWIGPRQPAAAELTETTALGPLRVPRGSFFQVNPPVADLLTGRVFQMLKAIRPQSVIDLYCGVGGFALAAGRAAVPRILGIDSDAEAISAAGRNAATLGFDRIRFTAAPASRGLAKALEAAGSADGLTLIADPPRAGLEKSVVRTILAGRPADVIYISCAADTLARDVKLLAEDGYGFANSQPVDMFPRTPYFESVTHLRRYR